MNLEMCDEIAPLDVRISLIEFIVECVFIYPFLSVCTVQIE